MLNALDNLESLVSEFSSGCDPYINRRDSECLCFRMIELAAAGRCGNKAAAVVDQVTDCAVASQWSSWHLNRDGLEQAYFRLVHSTKLAKQSFMQTRSDLDPSLSTQDKVFAVSAKAAVHAFTRNDIDSSAIDAVLVVHYKLWDTACELVDSLSETVSDEQVEAAQQTRLQNQATGCCVFILAGLAMTFTAIGVLPSFL